MPVTQSLQNNFIAGLKTEATGLNFPENAMVDADNVVPSLIGDVFRREGIDYEANAAQQFLEVDLAKTSYRWRNVGGDGQTEVIVVQRGAQLYFYRSSTATVSNPLSTQLLNPALSPVNVAAFQASGNVNTVALTECQFADGNGYLIVFHPDCDPFYCYYDTVQQVVFPNPITFAIRDFAGIPEPGVADNFRPSSLTNEHSYNLQNQGWTGGTPWTGSLQVPFTGIATTAGTITGSTAGTGFNATPTVGSQWVIPITTESAHTLTNGNTIKCTFNVYQFSGGFNHTVNALGSVTNYAATSVTLNIFAYDAADTTWPIGYDFYKDNVQLPGVYFPHYDVNMQLANTGFINTWKTQIGNYPSNSDIWFLYKDTSNVFNPASTNANVAQAISAAPKGSYVINPWVQNRSAVSGISGLTTISTVKRPSTGCWFQGRVFYTGVNASFTAQGDAPFTTWTENIYFSKIVENTTDFGKCYQQNDPTSEDFFDILPDDGGVITIQGSGAIYKLFPIENGLLVFAANGIWFITGSQGIGFTATDFAIRQVSKVQCLGPNTFVNVNGFPMFWNEEGVYYVTPAQFGSGLNSNATSFEVTNLALGSILTYYQNIPKQSKIFARGDYNPIDFIVQWVFRSTPETGITDRYNNDKSLNFNTANKAFYTYSFPSTTATITDIRYVSYPGASGTNIPEPMFKFIVKDTMGNMSFAEERDLLYRDFFSEDGVGTNFDSHFISGYNLAGKSLLKFQPIYVYLFLRNTVNNSYKIQGAWDYAISRNSSKWSNTQLIQDNTDVTKFSTIFRRHKIRGRGMSLSFKVTSVAGQPFDVIGWSVLDNLMQTV